MDREEMRNKTVEKVKSFINTQEDLERIIKEGEESRELCVGTLELFNVVEAAFKDKTLAEEDRNKFAELRQEAEENLELTDLILDVLNKELNDNYIS